MNEISPHQRRALIAGVSWWRVLIKLGLQFHERSTGVKVLSCIGPHEEKTPSLHCWPSGNFKCHGCGLHGDMVDFVCHHLFRTRVRDTDRAVIMEFFENLPSEPDHRNPLLPFFDP